MISFISLSREVSETCARIRDNVAKVWARSPVIDEVVEVVVVDGTQFDIFAGYNFGVTQTTNDILCFLHDDVKLLGIADCWEQPMALLNKPMTGVVGVAGSRLLPKSATWWEADNTECWGMVAHPTKQGDFGIHWNTWPHHQARFGRVAVLDGCFLMMHRRLFEKLGGFDAKNYSGYHFYDIDFSLRASLQGFQNYSAPIPLQHRSRGAVNENWEANRQIFLKLHGKHLPYVIKD